eukprot:GILK01005978.1.p1 GENE.GILK01005978.1~~GILK01005978.1.p1  ORF type:complete len:555 (+),score=48.50 GILK01005978.1:36-1667(+)
MEKTSFPYLPAEVAVELFSFIETLSLLRASQVSRQWNEWTEQGEVWRRLSSNLAVASMSKTPHHFRRFTRGDLMVKDMEWKQLYQELGSFGSQFSLIAQGLKSSSLDNESQDISQTLDIRSQHFWSSQGSSDPDSSEFLIYKLIQHVCVVSKVEINIYKALYQSGLPIYAPKTLQISVGFRADEFYYRSPYFAVEVTDDTQEFWLGPRLVCGGFLKIEFFGRTQTQPGDDLYYTVVRAVRCLGYPIATIRSPLLASSMLQLAIDKTAARVHDASTRDIVQSGYDDVPANQEDLARLLNAVPRSVTLEIHRKSTMKALEQMIARGSVEEACSRVLTSSPEENLRTAEVLHRFRRAHRSSGKNSKSPCPVRCYLSMALRNQQLTLNFEEAMELAKHAINENNIKLIDFCVRADKLECSMELGDLVRPHSLQTALLIYLKSFVPDKVVDCLVELGNGRGIIHYINGMQYRPDLPSVIRKFARLHTTHFVEFALALVEHQLLRDVDVAVALELQWEPGSDLLNLLSRFQDARPRSGSIGDASMFHIL